MATQFLLVKFTPIYLIKSAPKKLLANRQAFYPQFATHNAYSLATIIELAGDNRDFEFQCLHGMGDTLYDQIVGADQENIACRIYAPVGSHKHLLAYLVRRLLENGANSSFVNRIANESVPIDDLLNDPTEQTQQLSCQANPQIPLPKDIYGASRMNAKAFDLQNRQQLQELTEKDRTSLSTTMVSATIVGQ